MQTCFCIAAWDSCHLVTFIFLLTLSSVHLLGPPGNTLGSILYFSFPVCPFQSDCWKHEPCVHSSPGCPHWAVWLSVCPLWRPHPKTGEDGQANNNPSSPLGDHHLVIRRPSTAVLPLGVNLVSQDKTHTATVSPAWHLIMIWISVALVTGDIKAHQVLLNRVPEQETEDSVRYQILLLRINFRVEIIIFTQCDEVLKQ